nr:MAG TPA: hypothetical protein [Caudoviricetes sp.]
MEQDFFNAQTTFRLERVNFLLVRIFKKSYIRVNL